MKFAELCPWKMFALSVCDYVSPFEFESEQRELMCLSLSFDVHPGIFNPFRMPHYETVKIGRHISILGQFMQDTDRL